MRVKEVSIYLDREDVKAVEEEERNAFVKTVLDGMGVPVDEYWPEEELTVQQKIVLRKLLAAIGVDILDDRDRGVKIYVEDKLVAEWLKPVFILHKDNKARDPSKRVFFEMKARFWNMYDQGESNESV
jgi:hypothetical protein